MLCVLARNAKYGDRDAALKMIQQFQPLLQKYSRKLGYEDAYNDLILFFIELISKIPEHLIIESKCKQPLSAASRAAFPGQSGPY